MTEPLKRLRRLLLALVAMLGVGTVGYRLLTKLSWLDSLYFTVTTMSTVGFREVAELDSAGKLFTIALILMGVGLLFLSLSTAIEIFIDDTTRTALVAMMNRRRSRNMQGHYIVCGLGRVGMAVCDELAHGEADFLVIDSDPKQTQSASSRGWLAILGDASDDRILEQANIKTAKGLISCVNTDAVNLFVVVSAKSLNPNLEVSTRVNDENNVNKFHRAGAKQVYSPYSLLGRRIARAVTRPRVVELLDLALEQTNYDLTIEELTVSERSPLAWLSLKESGIRQNFGGVVMSIIRSNREIVHMPDPETCPQPGDILITLGTPDQLRKMREIVEMK